MIAPVSEIRSHRSASESTPPPKTKSSEERSRVRRAAAALIPTELAPVQREAPVREVAKARRAQEIARELHEAAARANAYFRQTETSIEFVVSSHTGRTIIRIVESETGKLVRQIPPEELVRLSERMSELRGLLFDTNG